MSYEIFAHHAHVFPENVRPDGTVDALLRTMDECGIARAVCFATFPSQLKAENEETNAWLAKRIRGEDRLHGFGVIDFERAICAVRSIESPIWAFAGSSCIRRFRNSRSTASRRSRSMRARRS